MIRFRQRGDFSSLTSYFQRIKEVIKFSDLDKYGREGVVALEMYTPKDTGLTSRSWRYKIEHGNETVSISFYNMNINQGVSIAVILQYGHGTRNGGWVEGRDYINPAVRPIFDKIAEEAWKEVTKT